MTSPTSEIIFEVSEDETDGGFSASALGYGIHTEGETLDEVRGNVREAVECYFDEPAARPRAIRLHSCVGVPSRDVLGVEVRQTRVVPLTSNLDGADPQT